MIDRKPFENVSREREEAVLRSVSGWLEPSEPRLARRNGISSAFKRRHMGNVGSRGNPDPWHAAFLRHRPTACGAASVAVAILPAGRNRLTMRTR
jgi:hypothetical protein